MGLVNALFFCYNDDENKNKGARKMKKIKRIVSVVTACASLFGFGACNIRSSGGEKGVLKISSFYGGYGNTWAQALADGYRAYNPSVKVEVVCNTLVRDEAVTAAQTNETDTDIYFVDGIGVGQYCETYGSLADLSEVYSSMPKAGDKTEEHCIEHLENCYQVLKKEENPGGLMCFTYYTFTTEEEALGNIGLDKLSNPMYNQYWKRLVDRVKAIGWEIFSGKFDEERLKKQAKND